MERGPTARARAELAVMDHGPVLAAIPGEIGAAHVAVDHHDPGIDRTDRRREHPTATVETQRFPAVVLGEIGGP